MSEFDIEKPSLKDGKWLVFNNATFFDINTFDCQNTIEGKCYTDKNLDECIEKCKSNPSCTFGHFIENKGNKFCMPIRDLKVNSSPLYRLRNKSYYPELKTSQSTVFVNRDVFSFPPKEGNNVFFMDHFNICNKETGFYANSTETNNTEVTFSEKGDLQAHLLQLPPNLGVGAQYIRVKYGDNITFNIPSTTLVMRRKSNDVMKWIDRGGESTPQSIFTLSPLSKNKKIGDDVEYSDIFTINSNVFILGLNSNNYLEMYYKNYNEAVDIGLNVTFSFKPQMRGYYCNKNNTCEMVPLSDMEVDKSTGMGMGMYKGSPVLRNHGCFGSCENSNIKVYSPLGESQNDPQKKSNIIIYMILVVVIVVLLTILLYSFNRS